MNRIVGLVTGINGLHFMLRCNGQSIIIKIGSSCPDGLPTLRSAMREQREVEIFYREQGLARGARAHRIAAVGLPA